MHNTLHIKGCKIKNLVVIYKLHIINNKGNNKLRLNLKDLIS